MPEIVDRAEQPYVGVRGTVTLETFNEIADRLPPLIGRLAGAGVALAGAPFFKYEGIDMDGPIEVVAGVPVASPAEPAHDEFAGLLPAGRYATLLHRGHPDLLIDRTAELLEWGAAQGLKWDRDGERWTCRLETFLTNPMEVPDFDDWETELAIKLA